MTRQEASLSHELYVTQKSHRCGLRDYACSRRSPGFQLIAVSNYGKWTVGNSVEMWRAKQSKNTFPLVQSSEIHPLNMCQLYLMTTMSVYQVWMVRYKGLNSLRCQSRAGSELAAAAAASQLPVGHRQGSAPAARLSTHTDAVWQHMEHPGRHPAPGSLLCRPGMEGFALNHSQPFWHFLLWGTLKSSSPFKAMGLEKGK